LSSSVNEEIKEAECNGAVHRLRKESLSLQGSTSPTHQVTAQRVDRATVSALLNYRLKTLPIQRLMKFLTALDGDVES